MNDIRFRKLGWRYMDRVEITGLTNTGLRWLRDSVTGEEPITIQAELLEDFIEELKKSEFEITYEVV